MTIISKEITDTHTILIEDMGDGFTSTTTTPHAVKYVAPLTSSEVDQDINYYASALVDFYNGIEVKYIRHFNEYFEEVKFNKTNTVEQQIQADNIYSALLSIEL